MCVPVCAYLMAAHRLHHHHTFTRAPQPFRRFCIERGWEQKWGSSICASAPTFGDVDDFFLVWPHPHKTMELSGRACTVHTHEIACAHTFHIVRVASSWHAHTQTHTLLCAQVHVSVFLPPLIAERAERRSIPRIFARLRALPRTHTHTACARSLQKYTHTHSACTLSRTNT